MLSKKAWRDRLHKKKLNDTHRVMGLKPDVGVGGWMQFHYSDEIQQDTFSSVGIMQVCEGVFYFGNSSQIENLFA